MHSLADTHVLLYPPPSPSPPPSPPSPITDTVGMTDTVAAGKAESMRRAAAIEAGALPPLATCEPLGPEDDDEASAHIQQTALGFVREE